MFDGKALVEREKQWARFHEWEAAHRRVVDEDAAWSWYQEAWQLAWDLGAIPHTRQLNARKVDEICQWRARLARLPWPT